MKTVKEFAGLLDEIKRDEFGSPKYKITEEQLLHFANVKIPKRYKTFQIRKKSGGLREINAPCYQLGIVLYFTNTVLKSLYTPSPSAMGFAEGRSVVDNAKMHVGHHYVFNIDLKDFFPSIPQPRVWARLQLPPFNFTKEIAGVVAGLCCHTNADKTQNVLPQGAATSPLLTNAICDTLDRRMRGVAKRFGLHYSRYADDMTFSSMHNVYQEGSDFREELKRIIEEQGFTMNEAKTRLLKEGRRQEVTGLTVNEVVNVSRQYISDLRWLLHVWETEGYAKAYSKFYPKYKKEKGYIKKGEPVMENVIGGKLNYLRMVRGENNEAYKKLQMRYDKLQQIVYVDNETDSKESYVYVQPYTMADFLADFSTTITLEVTSKKKLVGKCVLAGMEKVLPVSKSTQKSLCPDVENRQEGEVITAKKLENCFVTLCRSKGKNFWLITEFEPQRSKCLSIQHAQIDIDNLLTLWENQGLEEAVSAFQECIKNGTPIPSAEAASIEWEKIAKRGKVGNLKAILEEMEKQKEKANNSNTKTSESDSDVAVGNIEEVDVNITGIEESDSVQYATDIDNDEADYNPSEYIDGDANCPKYSPSIEEDNSLYYSPSIEESNNDIEALDNIDEDDSEESKTTLDSLGNTEEEVYVPRKNN